MQGPPTGVGPGDGRLHINADSADPSARKMSFSETLLLALPVQPSL